MAIDDASTTPTTATAAAAAAAAVCVVLGGRTFLGRSLVSNLLKSGNWIVRVADSAPSLLLDRHDHSALLSEAIRVGRASYFQVDVREKQQICGAIEGSSVVFHLAASDASGSDWYLNYMLIVQGTKNVINACRECGVSRLIYNSSADVVFDGVHSVCDGDESLPYPWKFEDILTDLKAHAEALVLFSSGGGLLTCALRPSNPFGPGDTHLVPFIVDQAKSVWAKFVIGNGQNMCDFTYADNIAHAHICAEQALCCGSDSVAGKAFFITNLEQMKFWEFTSLILEGLGYVRPNIRISAKLASSAVVLHNWVLGKFSAHKTGRPQLNPVMINHLTCTKTFSCSNAQKHIGYSPIVSLEEGVSLTVQSFSNWAEDSTYLTSRDYSEPSKADKFLGNGKVAEILLWRDEKLTFTYAITLLLLFYWFFLSGRTFISSTANLLLLLLVITFGHNILPSSIFGPTVKKIHSSEFEISEKVVKDIFSSIAHLWNARVVFTMRLLAKGDDLNVFLKVLSSLYFLKLLLSFSPSMMIGVGLVCMFTTFFVYEQYEDQVDRLMEFSCISIKRSKELLIRNLPVSLRLIF